MKRTSRASTTGFTIVELLIVIVVIAILAAITIVAYNGIQKRANNTAKAQRLNGYVKAFKAYKAANGRYPNVPDATYCLGTGFPDGDSDGKGECRDFRAGNANTYQEEDGTALNTALETVTKIGATEKKPLKNSYVGPYAAIWIDGYTVYDFFEGDADSECPPPTTILWNDGAGMLLCQFRQQD